jgi:aspartokinase
MRGTPGVAARLFGAIARAKVNVVAIAQGSSELNISLVVHESDRETAVRAVHEEFHAS